MGQYYSQRAAANDESRNHAAHHGEPWTSDEIEWVMAWDRTEDMLVEIAELLGRTIEACRQKFYFPSGESPDRDRPIHRSGWHVGFCTECGKMTDVWCDGSSVMLCEDCR